MKQLFETIVSDIKCGWRIFEYDVVEYGEWEVSCILAETEVMFAMIDDSENSVCIFRIDCLEMAELSYEDFCKRINESLYYNSQRREWEE